MRLDDRGRAASLELSHRILPTGEAVAGIGGELDACGLSALLRIALFAERSDHEFRLASPPPSLLKLLRITALDGQLLGATGPDVYRTLIWRRRDDD